MHFAASAMWFCVHKLIGLNPDEPDETEERGAFLMPMGKFTVGDSEEKVLCTFVLVVCVFGRDFNPG
jgi:hypothetical protein